MKCPKCGSEAVFENCKPTYDCKCGECNNSWQSKPTTAEMLLWLAENESIDIWHTATEGIIYVWRNGNAVKFKDKTLDKAIKQAYDWAKEQK